MADVEEDAETMHLLLKLRQSKIVIILILPIFDTCSLIEQVFLYIINQIDMKKLALLAFAILTLAGCGSKNTIITAKFKNGFKSPVKLIVSDMNIDSTLNITDTTLTLTLPVNNLASGYLYAEGIPTKEFILDGSKISIDYTSENPEVISAPNTLNAKLKSIFEGDNKLMEKYTDNINKIMSDSTLKKSEIRNKISVLGDSLKASYKDYYKKFLDENKDNYIGVYSTTILTSLIEDKNEVLELIGKLSEEAKNTSIIKKIANNIAAMAATSEGKMFKDFTIKETEEKTTKFSDYIGHGKYVLVDFWASWCGPCRAEIPNIKKVYEKYAGKNFDVLGVAVWDKPEDTLKAAEKEGITWSLILNAQKIPTELYGINGIPQIMLFSPDGIILKRDLRGENIEKEVAKYIKK